jgi:PKD repeat protein
MHIAGSDRPGQRRRHRWALIAGMVVIACWLTLCPRQAAAQPGALSVSAGGPYSGQVGKTVIFMARFDLGGRPPDTAIAFEWNFGDGAVEMGGQTTAHIYSEPGTFTATVTLFVLAGRQTAMDSTTVQISPQPVGQLSITAGGPYSGQAGQTIIFMARFDLAGRPPDTALQIEWNFGDGAVEMGQTTAHAYTRLGTFVVTVTLFLLTSRETATDSTLAVVRQAPAPITANAGGPYSGTVGQPITMTGSISPAGLAVGEWTWNFGDGTTGVGQTVQKTYNQAGTYTVTLQARPLNEGSVTATTTASVSAAPAQDERVPLPAGCSNQALTWRIGTPMETVARAVSPPGALASIFKLDAAQGRFRGFSPTAPSFANDYTMVEQNLEAVFFCMNAAGTLFRPAIGGSPAPAPTPNLVGPLYRWQGTLLNDGSTFTPVDPSQYTLQLFPDGTAAAQLDCNRSSGTYTINGNRLTLSFLATTLALCPPGSLSDRYLQQLNAVVSFFFQDGQLFLELMFDSGSMRFLP